MSVSQSVSQSVGRAFSVCGREENRRRGEERRGKKRKGQRAKEEELTINEDKEEDIRKKLEEKRE